MAANVNQIRPNIQQTRFSFRPPVGANLQFSILNFSDKSIHRFNVWKLGFTPISTVELDKVLRCYPKMNDAELLSFGFKYGFKLHYEGSRRLIETKKFKISYAKSLSS
jgi:hypothetical protein